jgi:hypothetical protein
MQQHRPGDHPALANHAAFGSVAARAVSKAAVVLRLDRVDSEVLVGQMEADAVTRT